MKVLHFFTFLVLWAVAETGESEDVGTRARPHCDGTGLCRAQIWRSGTHARKQCEIWAQFQPNPLLSTQYAVVCVVHFIFYINFIE